MDYGVAWTQRALNPLSGTAPIDANSAQISQPINWNLFNRPGDNTAVYIMTPSKAPGIKVPKYVNKIASLKAMILSNVNLAQSAFIIVPYDRLNYKPDGTGGPAPESEQDKENLGNGPKALTTEAGRALFQ
jgi:hypothetical protein